MPRVLGGSGRFIASITFLEAEEQIESSKVPQQDEGPKGALAWGFFSSAGELVD